MVATFKRILVPVDGSPTSDKALAAALQLAGDTGASLRLFHSVELTYATGLDFDGQATLFLRAAGEEILAKALAAAQAAGVAADSQLLDHPGERLGEAVADAARHWQADLIVVGTHGRHGVGRVLLGSGAEQIVRLAPVPVLVIRGESAT
ncbi:universal stress protein [Ramlibacter sp.]|uniref:universal stress protein n=1 Tax=Ramlibacter sp. TaxID=1917967 RepID=UPI002BC3BB71|nr:universal stress protein [Ramlibacter sp.]HWI83679.1 universal stress protein [Ramlibacter sp.]